MTSRPILEPLATDEQFAEKYLSQVISAMNGWSGTPVKFVGLDGVADDGSYITDYALEVQKTHADSRHMQVGTDRLIVTDTNDMNGGLTVQTGPTRLEETLSVGGATTLDATLDVEGATTLNSTLDVAGATTLGATLEVTGPTTLNNTLDVTGATTLGNTLEVTGAATLNNTLHVVGATTFDGPVTIGNAAGDAVTVTGTATVAEDLTLTKGLIVDTSTLVVDEATNRVGVLTATPRTALEVVGPVFVSGTGAFPSAGSGIDLYLAGGAGFIDAYNYSGSTFLPLKVTGLTIELFNPAGDAVVKTDATGLGFFDHATAAQQAVGSAASDLPTVITLANNIRTALRAYGLSS